MCFWGEATAVQPDSVRPLDSDEPTTIGPYRLLGRLGAGGMGRVYLGRSAGGRTVAVKVVHPHFALDEEFRARFRREVEAARRVGGDWTAPVLDADPTAAVPWVATGYVAGPSLASAVDGPDGPVPLPPHTVRVMGAGLAEALARVHGLGLVHRDVKPSNVLLTLDGPRLIDFGIARATDGTASLTSTGVSIGSPGYMAPEQILGRGVTGAADLFSLGAVLAFGATGRSPFPGDSSASLLYHVVHGTPELSEVPDGLRDVVAACLAKDPADRPGAGELVRLLTPEGPARPVAAGWLPGPLVAQVSRAAVRLLDLEAAEVAPPATPMGSPASGASYAGPPPVGGSGPVPFSSPSLGAPTGGGPVALGEFGPPDPSLMARPPGAGAGGDGTATPGRFSLTLAAARTRGADGRGRRLSCSVALAVAGALAAVTFGALLMPGLLPGDDGDRKDGGMADGARPSAADPAVPDRFLGTWEGSGTGLSGTLPMGTFTVTVRQGAEGAAFGTFRQVDPIGGICENVLILREAGPERVVATGRPKKSNPPQCTTGDHEVRLEPVGEGGLSYASDNARAGNPTARLSKMS